MLRRRGRWRLRQRWTARFVTTDTDDFVYHGVVCRVIIDEEVAVIYIKVFEKELSGVVGGDETVNGIG